MICRLILRWFWDSGLVRRKVWGRSRCRKWRRRRPRPLPESRSRPSRSTSSLRRRAQVRSQTRDRPSDRPRRPRRRPSYTSTGFTYRLDTMSSILSLIEMIFFYQKTSGWEPTHLTSVLSLRTSVLSLRHPFIAAWWYYTNGFYECCRMLDGLVSPHPSKTSFVNLISMRYQFSLLCHASLSWSFLIVFSI